MTTETPSSEKAETVQESITEFLNDVGTRSENTRTTYRSALNLFQAYVYQEKNIKSILKLSILEVLLYECASLIMKSKRTLHLLLQKLCT